MTESQDVVGRLGPKIRAEREEQGLSVSDLSSRSGVGRSTLADLEQSARTPTLDTLAKIAHGLGVPMPHLLDAEVTRSPVEAPLGESDGTEAKPLSIWREGDEQIEVYRLRVSTPIHRGRSRVGSRGYLTVITGSLAAGSAATPRTLTAGGQLAFAADQPHVFAPVKGTAEVVLVMRYPISEG